MLTPQSWRPRATPAHLEKPLAPYYLQRWDRDLFHGQWEDFEHVDTNPDHNAISSFERSFESYPNCQFLLSYPCHEEPGEQRGLTSKSKIITGQCRRLRSTRGIKSGSDPLPAVGSDGRRWSFNSWSMDCSRKISHKTGFSSTIFWKFWTFFVPRAPRIRFSNNFSIWLLFSAFKMIYVFIFGSDIEEEKGLSFVQINVQLSSEKVGA